MKLLYFTQFFYPEITAGAYRAYEHARILRQKGIDISIFTTYPNYPIGKVFQGYNNKLLSIETIDGISVFRSKIYALSNKTKLNRLLCYLSFMIYALINSFFNKSIFLDYDAILGTSGSVFSAFTAFLLSIKYKKKFIFELRDITWVQLQGVNNGKETIVCKILKRIELFLAKRADLIIVTTNSFKNILIENKISGDKIIVLPNYQFKDRKNLEFINAESEEEFTLLYMGTMGISQDIIELLKFFEKLTIQNKRMVLIGEGAEKKKVEAYIKEKRVKNVLLLDSVDKHENEMYYAGADIVIIKLKNQKEFGYFIPSKLYDIISNQKPILYLGPKGETSNLIENLGNGYSFCYSDISISAAAFSEEINNLVIHNNLRTTLREMGIRGSNYYDLIKKNDDIESLVERLLQGI